MVGVWAARPLRQSRVRRNRADDQQRGASLAVRFRYKPGCKCLGTVAFASQSGRTAYFAIGTDNTSTATARTKPTQARRAFLTEGAFFFCFFHPARSAKLLGKCKTCILLLNLLNCQHILTALRVVIRSLLSLRSGLPRRADLCELPQIHSKGIGTNEET